MRTRTRTRTLALAGLAGLASLASLGCETSGRALTDVKLTPLPSCDHDCF